MHAQQWKHTHWYTLELHLLQMRLLKASTMEVATTQAGTCLKQTAIPDLKYQHAICISSTPDVIEAHCYGVDKGSN